LVVNAWPANVGQPYTNVATSSIANATAPAITPTSAGPVKRVELVEVVEELWEVVTPVTLTVLPLIAPLLLPVVPLTDAKLPSEVCPTDPPEV